MAASMTSPLSVMFRLSKSRLHKVLCLTQPSKYFSQTVANTTTETTVIESTPEEILRNSRLQEALSHDDYFDLKSSVSLKQLFKARVHLGHNAGLRHETMSPFIFGERLGRDVIDLEQTLPRLQEALNLCAHIVYRGGMVLFLCRNAQVSPWVEKMAKEVKEYSHCRPWKRGIFTNAADMFNTLPIYPELCIFFNTQDTVFEQHRAVIESSKLLIPSIGFVDTNCNAEHVTYVIPGNDDTPDALHLYINLFRAAVLKAKEKRKLDGLESENETTS